MRLPVKALLLTIALLIAAQLIAITVESQAAALVSWYLIYALIILVPLVLADAGFKRYYRSTS